MIQSVLVRDEVKSFAVSDFPALTKAVTLSLEAPSRSSVEVPYARESCLFFAISLSCLLVYSEILHRMSSQRDTTYISNDRAVAKILILSGK